LAFIVVPFVWYYFAKVHGDAYADTDYRHYIKEGYVAFSVLLYVIAFLAPPTGWKRPHPYSDDPRNVPVGTKKQH
jgi:hypothetical protein